MLGDVPQWGVGHEGDLPDVPVMVLDEAQMGRKRSKG